MQLPVKADISLLWTFVDIEKGQEQVGHLFNPQTFSSVVPDLQLPFAGALRDAAVGP